MRWFVVFVFAACVLFGASCTASKPPDVSKFADNQAAVYLDGRYRGLTPREIRVRRSFGETSVTLRRGKEVVRALEVEWARSTGSYLPYLFGVDTEGTTMVYNVEDLEQAKDSTYIIPNLGVPIRIRDRTYGLTVWVED